jgi:hypothetical protein
MASIQDLVTGNNNNPSVLAKLNYRSDILTQNVYRWIVSAINNTTDTYPFEELCETDPIFVPLIVGQSRYNMSYFLPPGAVNAGREVTRIDSFLLQLDQSSGTCFELKYRTIKVVNSLSQIMGTPVFYTVYGINTNVKNIKQVLIAFSPQQAWNVQVVPQYKHGFSGGISDPIKVPDSWLEVIATAAAMIGADENRMTDRYAELKDMLYGNPDKKMPGLIMPLISSRAQMGNVNERQLTFIAGDR